LVWGLGLEVGFGSGSGVWSRFLAFCVHGSGSGCVYASFPVFLFLFLSFESTRQRKYRIPTRKKISDERYQGRVSCSDLRDSGATSGLEQG
jgi:hypothetical protein